ncbi:hypothetical protein [Streptomyces sp. NPDC003710]
MLKKTVFHTLPKESSPSGTRWRRRYAESYNTPVSPLGSDSDTRQGHFKNGTFEATLPVAKNALYFNVMGQLNGGGDINCSVTIDGKTKKGHASGGYNICDAQLNAVCSAAGTEPSALVAGHRSSVVPSPVSAPTGSGSGVPRGHQSSWPGSDS